MKNAKVKLTIWVIILVAGLIFFFQNRSPLIALVILGSKTIALPVGVWLILSAIAGVLTSIFLQFLLGVFVPRPRRSREWNEEEEGDFEFPEMEANQRESFTSQNVSNQEKTAQSERSEGVNYTVRNAFEDEDWEFPPQREDWNEIDEDWNIEEPPRQKPPGNFYDREKEQTSVYSYRYRGDPNPDLAANDSSYEPEEINSDRYNQQEDEEEEANSPQIYEANYRVIRPPLWNLPEDETEEDDEPDKR